MHFLKINYTLRKKLQSSVNIIPIQFSIGINENIKFEFRASQGKIAEILE